ncbi:MAG: response regulator [Opitutaceae bacterium]
MPCLLLTVDDSKTVRTIVRKAFKGFDCAIFEAGNGCEGLAAVARQRPDLILLDVTMPVMDGMTMLTQLRADPKLQDIPVLMLSTGAGPDIAGLDVRDYLGKPFKEDELIRKVRGIVDLKPRLFHAL